MTTSGAPLGVLHLLGSPTSDFHEQLSLVYARDALTALDDPARYRHHVAHVGPDGRWRFPPIERGDAAGGLSAAGIETAPSMTLAAALARLEGLDLDIALPQMFCPAGMTDYRALLDVLRLPYLGNRPDVMALALDKVRARAVVAAAGLAVPAGEVIRPGDAPTLPPPVVVKPADADNSHGVSLVRTSGDYDAALAIAWAFGERALVERYVELGREVRCGVVEIDDELVALPPEEYAVDPARAPVRVAEDKLQRDADGGLVLMAKDATHAWITDGDDPVVAVAQEMARGCHRALGARHYSLVDLRIDPDGRAWFLEASPYCSYAETSVLVTMARAAGLAVTDLFAAGVRRSLTTEDPTWT